MFKDAGDLRMDPFARGPLHLYQPIRNARERQGVLRFFVVDIPFLGSLTWGPLYVLRLDPWNFHDCFTILSALIPKKFGRAPKGEGSGGAGSP